jgi:hypothetical protein
MFSRIRNRQVKSSNLFVGSILFNSFRSAICGFIALALHSVGNFLGRFSNPAQDRDPADYREPEKYHATDTGSEERCPVTGAVNRVAVSVGGPYSECETEND